MRRLSIGKIASQASVSVEAVRYYERLGLIAEPERSLSGYRQYRPDVIRRIRFIKRAQEIGFSLAEIDELLSLRLDPHSNCADVRSQAAAKMVEIDEKIKSLNRMRSALEALQTACPGSGPTSECPILDALENPEDDP